MANARLSRQQVEVIGRLTSKLRVGGQSLMVAGAAQNGKLRVHGVTLEYMTKILPEEANSDIGVDHDVEVSHVASRGAESAIGPSGNGIQHDVSLAGSVYNKAPGNTLGPTESGIQQSVQVSVIRNLAAGNALSLDQDAFVQQPTFSDIGIDHAVQVSVVRNLSVGNTVGIDQGTGTNQHMEGANNNLVGLDSEATVVQAYLRSASSNLDALDQSLSYDIVKPVDNTIGVGHSIDVTRVRRFSAESELDLQQVAFPVSHPFASNTIGISHSVSVQKILHQSLSHDIGISHDWIRTGTTNARTYNVLSGWAWVWNPVSEQYEEDWREWEQTVEVEHIIGDRPTVVSASSQIELGQSVSYQAVFNRAPETDINIKQTLGFSFIQDTTFCDYDPSVGSSSNSYAPLPPPTTPPVLEPELYDGVQLSYPSVTPTDVIYLRGPELGNVDQFNTQRINRESRGGYLIIYRDFYWPRTKTMRFSFTGLTEQEGQEVLDFVETSVGKEVKLRDWEGREWLGVITSTNEPVVRERDGCNLTTDLEFELTDGT